MLCQKCGKYAATTHIKTVINGKVAEQKLCGYCAAKGGYVGFSSDNFTNLMASILAKSMQVNSNLTFLRCSSCGATFADIAESGKVGCANCYKEFYDELLPYLKRIHGSIKHTGKTSGEKQLTVACEKNTITELKSKLASLVAAENYEEAAKVRDEIKRMEAEG